VKTNCVAFSPFGGGAVQDAQAATLAHLVEPIDPRPPIATELQQELALMTAMRKVPDITGKIVTIAVTAPAPLRLRRMISASEMAA
jgi:hypothetical protein